MTKYEKPKDMGKREQSKPQGGKYPSQPQNKRSDWDLEASFDTVVSLEELINRSPFKESSGKDGGSYTAAARVPFWLERKITHLIEMRGSPYQLKSDVVRDAIYLGLRILNTRYKQNPDWAVEERMARTIDQVNTLNRIREQVRSFSRPVIDLWNNGDEEQARIGMESFVGAAVEIENDWQREKTLQLLRENREVQPIIDACSETLRNAVRTRQRRS